jgi:hypothetical protein
MILALLTACACWVGPAFAAEPDTASAEPMLRALYAPYLAAHKPEPPDPMRDKRILATYTPSLAALAERYTRLEDKSGDELGIEFDVLIHAQDWEIHKLDVTVQNGVAGHATAAASFVNLGTPEVVRFDLVWLNGRWRIDDIHWMGDDGSFRRDLVREIEGAKAELARPPSSR